MKIGGYQNWWLGVIIALCAGALIFLGIYGAGQISDEARRVGLMRAIGSNFLICAAIGFSFVLGAILALLAPMTLIHSLSGRNVCLCLEDDHLVFFDNIASSEPSGRIPWTNIKNVNYDEQTDSVKIYLNDVHQQNSFWSPSIVNTSTNKEPTVSIPNKFSKSPRWISRRIRECIQSNQPETSENQIA